MLITSGSQRVMLIWLKFPQRKFNIDCFGLKVITRHQFAYKLRKDKMDASLLHLWLSNILKQLPLGKFVLIHPASFPISGTSFTSVILYAKSPKSLDL